MRQEDLLNLYDGKWVRVLPTSGLSTSTIGATVRGLATTVLPVIGRSVIIEPWDPIGDFRCHTVFEIHLEELQ